MNLQSLTNEVPVEGEYSLEGIDFITSADQYLSFKLGDESYAVEILAVEEIRSWQKPTLIPNSADDIKGVINMRGTIVPIIDLRIKFNISQADYSPMTVIIVLAIESENTTRKMGFVVDAVDDVINAQKDEIKPYFALAGGLDSQYIEGLVNVNNMVISLLNLTSLQVLNLEHGAHYES